MEKSNDVYWNPVWLTIPEFSDVNPVDLRHREQETLVLPAEAMEYKNIHVLVRGKLNLKHGGNFCLKISADDRYKLYLDGEFIQEGPAPSHPEHYYYNEIKFSDIAQGEHVLGIHLYYQGCINRVFYSGDLRLGLAAELRSESGEQIPLHFLYQKTEAYQGEKIGYDTQFLENFDARKFPAGWNRTDFREHGWDKMVLAKWADYSLYPQPTKMLWHITRKPEKIEMRKDRIFVDAGRETVGNLSFLVEGKPGDKVIIRQGEELDEMGRVRYDMRCGCRYEEVFTLGEGECLWEPFDYKGFRYAEILPDEGVKIKNTLINTRHYPMDERLCRIASGDKKLEEIFEICKNAVKLGTQEGYLDCPTREKGQYLGDALITAHAQVLLTGETDMLLKCIEEFGETAAFCPGLLAVAPGGYMQEIADFSLLYPEIILLYYRFTGDRTVIEKYYGTVEGMLGYFRKFSRGDGLLEQVGEKWNLVDWPENLRDGYDFPLTRPVVGEGCHNVINALYLGAAKNFMFMAELLGRETGYENLFDGLKEAYYRAFFRKETGIFADSESSSHGALHSNVYPLYFHLAREEDREGILDFIEGKGFACGVMHSYFVLKVLGAYGRYRKMYELLVNEGDHGWVQMLREGATACFEAWGKEQKWNTSLCHPWACAPIPIIIEEIGGICPAPEEEKGYRFCPHIPKEIGEFCISVPFRGKILKVETRDGEIILEEWTAEQTVTG